MCLCVSKFDDGLGITKHKFMDWHKIINKHSFVISNNFGNKFWAHFDERVFFWMYVNIVWLYIAELYILTEIC